MLFLKKTLRLATDPGKTHLRNRFAKCMTSAELYSVPHVVGTLLNAAQKQLKFSEARTGKDHYVCTALCKDARTEGGTPRVRARI